MKAGICGISGRMGQAILAMLIERKHTLGAAFDHSSSPFYGKSVGEIIGDSSYELPVESINLDRLSGIDGVIDFTSPAATKELIEAAVAAKKPLVIGTTGFSNEEKAIIEDASKKIPIVFSPNMSVGVNVFFKLTELASGALSSGYDVEIFEAHHRFKKDAPSGTARKLMEIIKENQPPLTDDIHGREGIIGERSDSELGVMAMRGGDIVGEHTVFFAGTGERIELTHRATNRNIFARGAVIALEYVITKSPGLYSMYDVLGL